MKKIKTTIAVLFLLSTTLFAQQPEMKFDGSQPPKPEVLQLIQNYINAATAPWKTPEERANRSRQFMAKGYFYHGLDGAPISSDGVTKRQTKNELKIDEALYYDAVLYQYDNTALVTYKSYNRGMDKKKIFERFGSGILAIGKEGDEWKVLSDIIGMDPKVKKKPVSTKRSK